MRDWHAHPALLDLPTPPGDLYAVSDVHADHDRLATLLAAQHLVRVTATGDIHWCGGNATLVIVGDMINKGPSSLRTLAVIRSLQKQASANGGRVVALLGNNEAEFLANIHTENADAPAGINHEIRAIGEAPRDFASGKNPVGQWMRELPFGARIGAWFFAHAGDTHGRTFDALKDTLQRGADARGFRAPALIGDTSILRSRNWYRHGEAARYSAALGTRCIVAGHDPKGLGPTGSIGMDSEGTFFDIDCGLSRNVNYSRGMLLRVRREGHRELVHACGPDGDETLLLRTQLPT